jgi:hypothetical protein
VIESIFACAEVHVALIDSPPAGGESFTTEIEGQLRWCIHTVAFFYAARVPFAPHSDDAADSLAILGMKLLRRGQIESAIACGEVIATIARNCSVSLPQPYEAAALYENLEILARAAEALRRPDDAAQFRCGIASPIMPPAGWSILQGLIAERLGRLDEELECFD